MKILESYNKINKMNIAETIASTYANSDIPDYIKNAILNRVIWIATENDDNGVYKKYFGQPYWSEGAINQLQKNIIEKIKIDKNLRHEHSVPKKEIIKKIINCNKSKQEIFDILDKYAHSVVVSLDEDRLLDKAGLRSKMPELLQENLNIENIFSRYFVAGIKIYSVGFDNPKDFSIEKIDLLKNII